MSTIARLLADLFRLHHGELVRFVTRLVGSRDNGEDIVQDAYMRFAGRNPQAGAIADPKAYLFTAARNAAIDFTVRQRAEWSYRVDIEDVSDVSSGDDPLANLERSRRLARLAIALNELPPHCRLAFFMNKIEGRGHSEIAARLGVSVSMVEKHMMRALKHCRDRLREDDSFAAD
jgi:RNA polymerase sigma factor (sigma-70 family)